VVGALQTTGVVTDVLARVGSPSAWSHGRLVVYAAALSNLVSNVPAVMLLVPAVTALEDATAALLATAMAATLAGNLTLVGSVANLIVAEIAKRHGVHVGFWPYLAVGAPVTLLTLAIGTALTAP
jgi:Na+/H+ antiporter NhaD/arsenite permease-like protein